MLLNGPEVKVPSWNSTVSLPRPGAAEISHGEMYLHSTSIVWKGLSILVWRWFNSGVVPHKNSHATNAVIQKDATSDESKISTLNYLRETRYSTKPFNYRIFTILRQNILRMYEFILSEKWENWYICQFSQNEENGVSFIYTKLFKMSVLLVTVGKSDAKIKHIASFKNLWPRGAGFHAFSDYQLLSWGSERGFIKTKSI